MERNSVAQICIKVFKNFIIDVPWGGMGTTKTFDLRKLNDKAILELFKSAIEKWSWRDGYFYLNSDLLSSEYANYVLG